MRWSSRDLESFPIVPLWSTGFGERLTDAIFLKASCSESCPRALLTSPTAITHSHGYYVVSGVPLIEKTGQISCSYRIDVTLTACSPIAVYDEARTHGDPAGKNLLKLPPDRRLHRRSNRAWGRGGPGVVEFANEALADTSDECVRVEGSVQGCGPPSTHFGRCRPNSQPGSQRRRPARELR